MPALNSQNNVQRVTARLTEAWAFLSGEQRRFELLDEGSDPLAFARYSFFMSLASPGHSRLGGVGVLIQAEDGMRVARHMFGIPIEQLSEAEARDACSEACNVFADCIAKDFNSESAAHFTLPRPASPEEYASIAENSLARTVYQGVDGGQKLLIVLYDRLQDAPLEKE